MATTAYQIKIELSGSKPKIWRRLIIPSNMLLSDLHKVLQTAMGWTNSHLHMFIKGRVMLEPPAKEDFGDFVGIDYTGYTVDRLLVEEKDKIQYEYDFGDSWNHGIILEKEIENYIGKIPVCTAGAMNCPPENVGGMWGFEEFKKIMKNPSRPEYEEYYEWFGEEYDPKYFDKDEINEMLQDDNFGVIEW